MKTRGISGIYFRYTDPETFETDNICFEDLPREEQERIIDKYTPDMVKRMALLLAGVLKSVIEECDIVREE